MLTLKILKKIGPHEIFSEGISKIEHPYFNDAKPVSEGGTLEPDGKSTKVKWVAVRGSIHDWAIFHSMGASIVTADFFDDPIHLKANNERIASTGAKLCKESDIRRLIPCDDEAFQMYNY